MGRRSRTARKAGTKCRWGGTDRNRSGGVRLAAGAGCGDREAPETQWVKTLDMIQKIC